MDSAMMIAAAVSFIPTLLLFYYVLRGYTYPVVEEPFFKDSTVITLLFIGLIEGFLISAFYMMFADAWKNVLIGVGFAIVQVLAVLVVLNLKRFHGKSDTVFYGFGLGLGQGTGMSFGVAAMFINASGGMAGMDVLSWALLIVFIASELLLMCSVGTNVGEGVARLRFGEFCMQALLVAVLCMIFWSFTAMASGSLLWIVPAFLMLGASAYYFYRTVYKGMSSVVADVLKIEGKKRNDMPR